MLLRMVVPFLAVWLVRCACAQEVSGSLAGTLRDGRGVPVASTIVSLEPVDHSKTFSARTDAQGKYRFSIPPGVYILSATRLHSQARLASILVGPKESKTADLVLVEEPRGSMPSDPAAPTMQPQFSDEPEFTVAGVKDTTNLGGHGSDAIVHARNNLARETASLGKSPASDSVADMSESAKSLREQSAADPNNADLHHRLGELEEQLQDPLEAVREFQRAADLNPSESYLFDWGSELLLHHAPEPAVEVFAKGNRLFPKSTRMQLGLGAAYFALGSSDRAVRETCTASDLDPGDPSPYLFLGKMLQAEKTAGNQVVAKLRRFASLQPQNADANYFYALALSKRAEDGQARAWPEIESLLNRAVEIKADFAAAYLQLGAIYSQQHANDKAIAALERAVQADPQMEEAHYRLSQIYRKLGENEKSKQELQIYEQLSKESEQQTERERHEIRQFVYTLRDQPSAKPR